MNEEWRVKCVSISKTVSIETISDKIIISIWDNVCIDARHSHVWIETSSMSLDSGMHDAASASLVARIICSEMLRLKCCRSRWHRQLFFSITIYVDAGDDADYYYYYYPSTSLFHFT